MQTGPEIRGRRANACGGQALVEFAASAVITIALIMGVVEFGRIMMVYTTISDAARIGARYAITHAPSIPGSGSALATTVTSTQAAVTTVVKSFLAPATVNINAAGLSITTTYPDSTCSGTPSSCTGTSAGSRVQVTVSYPYDMLVSYYPLSFTLASTSEGIITW